MAETEATHMSRHSFSVAYSGAEREDEHTMSVEALAPALLAFGRLMRAANTEFNGKNASANIYVTSDFEHRCFNINFDLAISLYEQIKDILGFDEVKTAKDILEWLGLLTPTGVGGISFLAYLKWKRGRRVVEKQELTDQDRSGMVAVRIDGDENHVEVHNHILNLSENQHALRATRDAFTPVGQEGFDRVDVSEGGTVSESIPQEDAEAIIQSCNAVIENPERDQPDLDETTAWLSVYSPVYDESADKWRFILGREPIYVDISETTIARDALIRGGAMVDDTYQVRLEIATPPPKSGRRQKPSYKILEVLRFIEAAPALKQVTMELPSTALPARQLRKPKGEE